jgi:hypothetical protein
LPMLIDKDIFRTMFQVADRLLLIAVVRHVCWWPS